MKLLFDENLSRKLPRRLAELYPGSQHLFSVGLLQVSDRSVWAYARDHGFTIVTADADFFNLAISVGPPPKIIWLRRWTHPTRDAEALLRREATRITDFARRPELRLLILDKL